MVMFPWNDMGHKGKRINKRILPGDHNGGEIISLDRKSPEGETFRALQDGWGWINVWLLLHQAQDILG